MLEPLLALLFCTACASTVALWAYRQPKLVRYATLASFTLSFAIALVQQSPATNEITHDRLMYQASQLDFAQYLQRQSPGRAAVEIGAALIDKLAGTRDLINSRMPKFNLLSMQAIGGSHQAGEELNWTQVTFGATALLLSGLFPAAPGILWATLVSLGLGVFLAETLPRVPAKRQKVYAVISVLSPAAIWFRTINTKEPLLLAATLMLFAAVIRFTSGGKVTVRTLVGPLVLFAIIFMTRGVFALMLAVLLVSGLLVTTRRSLSTWALVAVIGVGTLTVARYPALFGATIDKSVQKLTVNQLAEFWSEQFIEAREQYGAAGGSSDLDKTALSKGPAGLLRTPIFVLYYLFSPFPWQGGTALLQLGKIQALLYWGLIALYVRNLFAWRRLTPDQRLFVWIVGGLTVILAIAESNQGTIMRHRATWEPLLFYACLLVPFPARRTVPAAETPEAEPPAASPLPPAVVAS